MPVEPSLETWIEAFLKIPHDLGESIDTDHPLWWADERTMFALKLVDY